MYFKNIHFKNQKNPNDGCEKQLTPFVICQYYHRNTIGNFSFLFFCMKKHETHECFKLFH